MDTARCAHSFRRPANPLLMLVLIAFMLGGCNGCLGGLLDESENWRIATENALNTAISSLNNASADWQRIVEDLQENLPQEVQSTVRVEVANLASRTIGQAGVELRCNVDFLRKRVREGLQRILAHFLGRTPPPVEPSLCQVVPLAVERDLVPSRIRQIEFYGYNFDQRSDLKVFHERTRGREDVTARLDHPTHYAMTLKFGATGVQLDAQSHRFVLEWGGRVISTIGVIQPQTPVCRTRVERLDPAPITFMPPHTRGDRDFKGHGPTIETSVGLIRVRSRLSVLVNMKAFESNSNNSPRSDFTTAQGFQNFVLFDAPTGWRITRVRGVNETSHTYRDNDHSNDLFNMGSGGPVRSFTFVGDTDGNDAGVDTKVDITFNRLILELVETSNCISAQAVMSAHEANMISDAAFERLQESVTQELAGVEQQIEALADTTNNQQ